VGSEEGKLYTSERSATYRKYTRSTHIVATEFILGSIGIVTAVVKVVKPVIEEGSTLEKKESFHCASG